MIRRYASHKATPTVEFEKQPFSHVAQQIYSDYSRKDTSAPQLIFFIHRSAIS